ncbi:helicase HerA domain-containing protein (plasmid) [Komagataeibacter sucrofermentans]|nr:DUF87 domain-containing protein [Komagataeibacter sucrofermentans]
MSQLQKRSEEHVLVAEQARAEQSLALAQSVISQDYLSQLEQHEVLKPQLSEEEGFSLTGDIRIFRVLRLVQENRQAVLESTTAAYAALGAANSSLFFYIQSSGIETALFIGVRGQAGAIMGQRNGELLEEVFRGHFPGSRLESQSGDDIKAISSALRGTGAMEEQGSVTAVTGVPGLSSDDRSMFIQGLERFIDASEGKRYQALLLVDPVSPAELATMRAGCERLASLVSPLAKTTTAYNQSESRSIAESLTKSINEGFSETHTEGTSTSKSRGENEQVASESTGRSIARGALNLVGAGVGIAGAAWAGGALLTELVGGIGLSSLGTSFIPQKTRTVGTSWGTQEGTNRSTATGTTRGSSTSEGETTTDGASQGVTHTIEHQNKTVEQFLKTIDCRLERIEEARSYGGWNAAAYFVAETPAVSEALASTYMGLLRGAASGRDAHAITTWSDARAELPRKWLSSFHHPRISASALTRTDQETRNWVSPTVMVSSREAAMLLNLPRRSASTLPVLEAEPFGRSIQRLDGVPHNADTFRWESPRRVLKLGCIRHLWEDLPQRIDLDLEQLRTHAFVTGTTGSGKSNTLYLILHQLLKEEIPFLVIEPAKGEYAQVFGGYEGVNCFDAGTGRGTGLKINPFRFPVELHILEHIDRLTGIFCVCWPLYAAMPALLKDAVIVAYERAGWDVGTSTHIGTGRGVSYPDFTMLLSALEDVIAGAEYGERLQGEYTGALCTRVRSLTMGINGQIFTADETGDVTLFDKTALVDLSRIGSAETKSLIMGVLVMRLVEYRQARAEMNAPLRHVTVLEEAHNLLRANHAQDSGEQGSMVGKSVEMLTDAIAEMRTYGEGFMIVDQSPQAVHRAAIRNTGTKIALRLPDEEDRHVLGGSIGLNAEQIREIGRLPNGVAVIHQSGWLEAVLGHVDHFDESADGKPLPPSSGRVLSGPKVQRFRKEAIKLLLWPYVPGNAPDIAFLESVIGNWPEGNGRLFIIEAIHAYKHKKWPAPNDGKAFYEMTRQLGDISGLRRQVALLAAKDITAADLFVRLDALVKRSLGSMCPSQDITLEQALLYDWAGSDNFKRQQIVDAWQKVARPAGNSGS